jgi:GH18 family chitinase
MCRQQRFPLAILSGLALGSHRFIGYFAVSRTTFHQLAKFKKQHPDVKTPISIGGWAKSVRILRVTRMISGSPTRLAPLN